MRTAMIRNVAHFDTADETDVFRIERDAIGHVLIIDRNDNEVTLTPDEARLLAKALLDAAGPVRS